MVLITGDTHGEFNDFLSRLYQFPITEKDTAIVCGDFGFVWDTPYHRHYLKQLADIKGTLSFIDGNHENYDLLNEYPIVDYMGGKAHKVADNIYHLMRGQLFSIEGKTFFTMGGAYSVDKAMRVEHRSWWKEELPNNDEYKTAEATLKACGYKVDYVITHTIPQSIIHHIGKVPDPHDAELTGYFEWLYNNLEFKKWFAGHWHINREVNGNVQILFDKVCVIE